MKDTIIGIIASIIILITIISFGMFFIEHPMGVIGMAVIITVIILFKKLKEDNKESNE